MSVNIVCLDGHALNPGDLSWAPFESLGRITVHPRTPEAEVVARAEGAGALLTNKTPLSAASLAALPTLRYIGVLATGYNIVDVAAARERGIVVSNVPTYGTDSVAQHVFALLLELVRPVRRHADAVARGDWTRNPDWCFAETPITSLDGLTLGVVGFGRIGQAVARIGAACGMRLCAFDTQRPSAPDLPSVEFLSLDELFESADVVSLHCPLTAENTGMVNAERIARMKSHAIILNTSRGPLIDSQALADALHAGRIGGAGLDVLDVEPPPEDHPLLQAPRCVVTPHIAWYARSARQRLMEVAAENLAAFLRDAPQNRVN